MSLHSVDSLAAKTLETADSLCLIYEFSHATSLLDSLGLFIDRDSSGNATGEISPELMRALDKAWTSAVNGQSMSNYVAEPVVVGRERFSISDFFLFYPLADHSWIPAPNALDAAGGTYAAATYAPNEAEELYFSACDGEGIRNIYCIQRTDSLWTRPELVGEDFTSEGDEIFPILSSDGKTLWFASSGLYGAGGFDLYVSTWDESSHCWGFPENMGFPYSSPADDFLFMNTDDGKYSIFASNRNCPKDSVEIFVLEYEAVPVKRAMTVEQLRNTAALKPVDDLLRMDNTSAVSSSYGGADISKYIDASAEVRALKDSITILDIAVLRTAYASAASDDEREMLSERILSAEGKLDSLETLLSAASARLQKIEREFLFSGIALDKATISAEADREVVGAGTNYAFTRKSLSQGRDFLFAISATPSEYELEFLSEGSFADIDSLPDGLIYQIQIISGTTPASVHDLKGLSPVYQRQQDGLYISCAGVFHNFSDCLGQLNAVRALGFRDAFITAFVNGKPVPVNQARSME